MIANIYYTEREGKEGIAIYTNDRVYDLWYVNGEGTPIALKSMYMLQSKGYALNFCGFVK